MQTIKFIYWVIAIILFALMAFTLAVLFTKPVAKILFESVQTPRDVALRLFVQISIFILTLGAAAVLAAIWPLVPIILGGVIHLDVKRDKEIY